MATRNRKENSPAANFAAGLLLFLVLPVMTYQNYGAFTEQARGTLVRSYVTGTQKSRTVHQVVLEGNGATHELAAWNCGFGGLPVGSRVEKCAGSFWAITVPESFAPLGRPGWTFAPVSLAVFPFAVVLPALAWLVLVFTAVDTALRAVWRAVRWPFVAVATLVRRLRGARRAAAAPEVMAVVEAPAPAPLAPVTVAAREAATTWDTCPTCAVPAEGEPMSCGTCGAFHRAACWVAHPTCGALGCDGRPVRRRIAA